MSDVIVLVLGTGGILLMAAYAVLCERILSMFDLVLGAVVSAGLLFYLVWALVRPEDF